MKIHLETERLILRPVESRDAQGFFIMDSNREVQRYLGDNIPRNANDSLKIIEMIQAQYREHGVGRLAVTLKKNGSFLGWCGLKKAITPRNGYEEYYDLGYRFQEEHWARGYATESSRAVLAHGFEQLELIEVIGEFDTENQRSAHVLQKLGFRFLSEFQENERTYHWTHLTRDSWTDSLAL